MKHIKIKKLWSFLRIVIIAELSIYLFCTEQSLSGSDIGNENAISLTGKVLNKSDEGVPNVIAKLSQIGFSDTTNSKGEYTISASKETIEKLGINLDSIKDTVIVIKNNSLIGTLPIPHWIDTLPPIYVCQRGFLGNLLTKYTEFKRIESVLSIDNDTTIKPKITDFDFQSTTFRYSGYIYFFNTSVVEKYSIYINIYNKDSVFVGRSPTVKFTSKAGDIVMPDFNPFNATPTVDAGNDTTVSINDTIRLHAVAVDSFGGAITKYEWSINGGDFVKTSSGDTAVIAPADSNSKFKCIIRVTDNDGNVATDEVSDSVLLDPPTVTIDEYLIVNPSDTIKLRPNVSHRFGYIKKWEWSIGNNDFVETHQGDTTMVAPSTDGVQHMCRIRVTDDDGNSRVDSILVVIKQGKTIAAGGGHSLMIKPDGTLWACGFNDNGQIGDGTIGNKATPVMIMSNVHSISAGSAHSLILKSDGSLWACGCNTYCQLGDGTNTYKITPMQIMTSVQSVAAGGAHSLILKTDGSLWACGFNEFGQLGDSSLAGSNTPVLIMINVRTIAAGSGHSLILKTNGSLWACGLNIAGQLGNDTNSSTYRPNPIPLQIMTDVKNIAAGGDFTFIIKNDNSLWACGSNYAGQLGNSKNNGIYEPNPSPLQIPIEAKNISARGSHTLIQKPDNTFWACGNNMYGQLGNSTNVGTEKPNPTPMQIILP